jgi:catechol 2,3-dioxygenase-like lactoylglutathione lyase family enzyme
MVSHIDHLVLTVRSLEDSCRFYERVLKFTRSDTPGKPTALHFGTCKINVHQIDRTFEPKAMTPTPGSADFCLITGAPITAIVEQLRSERVHIEAGPVERQGAVGPMISVYFRDPDRNLIEISSYLP